MLLCGLLAVCQMLFLPGYLLLRTLRIRIDNRIQGFAYAFALSTLCNYLLVSFLTIAHCYDKPRLITVVAIESIAFLWLCRKTQIRTIVVNQLDLSMGRYVAKLKNKPLIFVCLIIPAVAAIFSFAWLCVSNVGTVFTLWDDFVSWDPWAMKWANGEVPHCGLYPQLIPANWSISYVLIETTNVKLFAKTIMPFFALGNLFLFFDLFARTRKVRWIVGLSAYALLLDFVFDRGFIASGYVDVPCAFFCFLAFYSAYLAGKNKAEQDSSSFDNILPVVFACEASLCKQGGLYFLALALIWYAYRVSGKRPGEVCLHLAAAGALVAFLDFFYIAFALKFGLLHGGNFRSLVTTNHNGRAFAERWKYAFDLLRQAHQQTGEPVFWIFVSSTFASVLTRQGLWTVLIVVLPLYVAWAFLFSYDQRFLSIVLPFSAACVGCTAELAVHLILRAANRIKILKTENKVSTVTIICLCMILTIAASFILKATAPALKSDVWLLQMQEQWVWPLLVACALIMLPMKIKVQMRASVPFAALCLAFFVLYLQEGSLSSLSIRTQQRELMKQACNTPVNKLLYEANEKSEFGNSAILTDYIPLLYLPVLRNLYVYEDFSQDISRKRVLDLVKADRAKFILARSACWPADTLKWLTAAGGQTKFEISGYTLVKLPPSETALLPGRLSN